MTAHRNPNTTTRRGMLGIATVGLGAAIGGTIVTPVAGYLLAPTTEETPFRPVPLGPIGRFTQETGFRPTPTPYVEDPAQPLVSSGLAYVHHTGGRDHNWLAPGAMFVVFSNRCTHVGCPAEASAVGFSCPCHGSQFNTRGDRTAGPAVRPLDRFQWEIRRDRLWITDRWSVLIDGDRVGYYPVKAPGQPLDGQIPAADALYPAVTYESGPAPVAN